MCGILGTVPKTPTEFFTKALETLTHRGPDSFGVEHFNEHATFGTVKRKNFFYHGIAMVKNPCFMHG